MSHGGNYSSNDWNDSRQQQQQHEQNDYSQYAASMPPSYERNINNGDQFSDDGYDEAPVAAGPRFGRPPATDFNAESDYNPRLQQRNGRNGLSENPIQHTLSASVPRQASLSDRYFDGSMQFNANSMWSDQAQGSSDGHRFADTNVASDTAMGVGVGVGVGIDANLIPYPSLSPPHTSVASYPSASQPGAVASASASRSGPRASRVLPPKKEATPIMPPSLAVEPTMPAPRVNRRYLQYTRLPRQPDLVVAKKVKNARYKVGDEDKQVLKCPNCQSFLKIPKMAVLMQCPTCSTVSPATSSSSSSN
ncbi:hypothetical protein MHU86_23540 [Fragilaria crotonensis]|nr:hypothetical protein MHU86_23540 [Fragilaria crotonensis]